MPTKMTNRPDRGQSILHELETHFGRSYTVEMVMMALGYKEFERSATRQAIIDLNRHGKVTRTSRGRYMAVRRFPNGVVPADTTLKQLAENLSNKELVAEAEKSPEPTTPVAQINTDLTITPVSANRPAMFTEYIETVHVIGTAKDGKWIGVGMSDGTIYKLEEV